jgi:hydroxyacylglutathione hydrolase
MLFRTVYHERLAAASYLIGCQRTGEALVIDPLRDVDRFVALARRERLRITAVAETHIHADFLSGARELAELTGCTLHLSDEGGPDWSYRWLDQRSDGGRYPHRLLRHGDVFAVGAIDIKAVHTPGHTPEHLCFLITDRGSGATEPMGLISGDFVFVGDLGRPDLLETAAGQIGASEPSAHRLFGSVQAFLGLPDWLQVWPAHGAGSACGKALGAVPQTTVGYERRFNPAILAAAEESSFVRFILEGQPDPPLYFARVKRLNRDGPPLRSPPGAIPTPARLSAANLASLDGRRTAIIDTRPWAAFRSGHLPGSLHLPLTNSFTTDAGSLIEEGEPIAIIAEPEALEECMRELLRIGLDRIGQWAEPAALVDVGRSSGALAVSEEVSVEEARHLIAEENPFILDVRRQGEFAQGSIPGATCIAHTRLASRLAELPPDRKILVHCQGGARSARALSLLERRGLRGVNMAGGFGAWQRAGVPVAR